MVSSLRRNPRAGGLSNINRRSLEAIPVTWLPQLRGLSNAKSSDALLSPEKANPLPSITLTSTAPSKILIVRFSALGDVIQTLPMLTWLRRSFPDAKIGWAINEELASAIEGHPCLDFIHPIARKRWSRELKDPKQWGQVSREFRQYIDNIKAVDYDVAIDTQSLFKTAATIYFAGIKRRVGLDHNRELSGLFLNEKYISKQEYFDPAVHHMEHFAILARAVGCTDLEYGIQAPPVPPEMESKVCNLITSGLPNRKPIVAVAPGTQWVSKLWPEQYWVGLISTILKQTDLNVLMVGSPGDASLCERIVKAIPAEQLNDRVFDISGKTNIREMYAVYQNVAAAIGPDSAPQHIAGAVKTPCTIAIFGPTEYRRTPPFGSPVVASLSTEGTLSCQPCHKKTCRLGTTECMAGVTVDSVFAELIQGLNTCNISFVQSNPIKVTSIPS